MARQTRIAKGPEARRGPYRLRVRAEAMAHTRQRITEAAMALHGSVGPAATTMSAVAAQAGVTRATLYRHFPTEEALFAACSRDWLGAHPRPSVAAWALVNDPGQRLRRALGEMYAYYRETEPMLANLLRDAAVLPGPVAGNLASYPAQMLAVLDAGWPRDGLGRVRRATILHAVAFETWCSLSHAGLGDEEAAELMAGLVTSVGKGRRAGSSS